MPRAIEPARPTAIPSLTAARMRKVDRAMVQNASPALGVTVGPLFAQSDIIAVEPESPVFDGGPDGRPGWRVSRATLC